MLQTNWRQKFKELVELTQVSDLRPFGCNDHDQRNREDICLQTLLFLFKCANHRNKRPFVSTANEALVGTLMTIGDANDIFAIKNF